MPTSSRSGLVETGDGALIHYETTGKALHGHTVPQHARDVRTVVETLDADTMTLVGWSLAGSVVLDYWSRGRGTRTG